MNAIKNLLSNLHDALSSGGTARPRRRQSLGPAIAEQAEQRQLLSVSNQWFVGTMLVVKTDNNATSVTVSQSNSQVKITEVGTNRSWVYSTSQVTSVEFQGGNGNDRFVNYIANMSIRAFGGYGNDYLEGYNGADYMDGGYGDDTLVGYGGNDQLVGRDGNDIIRGGAGNDMMWGGIGNDTILGEDGDDQLMGDQGNDHLNGGAGLDKLWGGDGNDMLIAIDNGTSDIVQSDAGSDVIWVDLNSSTTDRMAGNTTADIVQKVAFFTNGADQTLNGDRITDPNGRVVDDKGNVYGTSSRTFSNIPLFSTGGPSVNDIYQGAVGDCYFLAGLGAIAMDSPRAIVANIVDFNDGTYGVRLGNSFYRVDNDLPTNSTGDTIPAFAQLGRGGATNYMWVAVAEKAFAHYRTGANSYASISGGWSVEVNRAFRTAAAGDKSFTAYTSAAALANEIYNRWNTYGAVTVGFAGDAKKAASNTTPLILGHMYTVTSVTRNSSGVVTSITMRNPWGYDGGTVTTGDAFDGYIMVTPAQLWGFRDIGRVNWGKV